MTKYLNLITFVLEKLVAFGGVSVALYLSIPIFEYTQLLYFGTLFMAFIGASTQLYTAKLQVKYAEKTNREVETGFRGACRSSMKNGFHSELSRTLFLVITVIPCLLIVLGWTNFFELQKINSAYAFTAFFIFVVSEIIYQMLLQHLRFGAYKTASYYFRLVGLMLRLIALVFGIFGGNLIFTFFINGVLLFALLGYLFYGSVSPKRLLKLARTINVSIFFKNAFCLGVIASCSTLISGFERLVIPRLSYNADKLEIFAQLKFYQGVLVLMIPFVGFWLAPLATTQISAKGLKRNLITLISSLNFYFFAGSFCSIYVFYKYLNSDLVGFSISELAIFSLSCSAVLVFNLLNVVFFNSQPRTVSVVTGFVSLAVSLTIITFPSIHSITIASYIIAFGSIVLLYILRSDSWQLIKPLVALQFLSLLIHSHVIYFGATDEFVLVIAFCLFCLCILLEVRLKFHNLILVFVGGKS